MSLNNIFLANIYRIIFSCKYNLFCYKFSFSNMFACNFFFIRLIRQINSYEKKKKLKMFKPWSITLLISDSPVGQRKCVKLAS